MVVALAMAAPGWALNRGLLVKELQLPRIALNLNVTFSTDELQIPLSATPEADLAATEAELAKGEAAELLARRAQLMQDLGRAEEAGAEYRKALDALVRAITIDPRNAKAYALLAEVLLAVGDEPGATACAEEALILDDKLAGPHEVSARLHLRAALQASGRGETELAGLHFRSAEQEAALASRLAPNDAQPVATRFLVRWLPLVIALQQDPRSGLAQIAKFEETSEALKAAVALAPHYPRLRAVAIICKLTPFFTVQMVTGLDVGLWKTLDAPQQRVLTSCRDDLVALAAEVVEMRSEMLIYAAIAEWMMDNRKATYQRLREAANAAPNETAALETMVGLTAYEGQWTQALPLAEELLKRKTTGRTWVWIGRIQSELARWRPAEQAFAEATRYEDAQWMANLGVGVVRLRGNAAPTEALAPLRAAWEKAPDEPEVLYAYGVALALTGDLDQGRRCVAQALEQWPATANLQRVAKELGIGSR